MSELRRRRLALGLSQGTLAALSEVNQATISRAELNQIALTPEAQRRIEQVLRALEEISRPFPVRLDLRDPVATRELIRRRPVYVSAGQSPAGA